MMAHLDQEKLFAAWSESVTGIRAEALKMIAETDDPKEAAKWRKMQQQTEAMMRKKGVPIPEA